MKRVWWTYRAKLVLTRGSRADEATMTRDQSRTRSEPTAEPTTFLADHGERIAEGDEADDGTAH